MARKLIEKRHGIGAPVMTANTRLSRAAALNETIAAIGLELVNHSAIVQRFYERYGESISGWPGLYRVVIEAAEVLEDVARTRKVIWGDTHDWILVMQYYAVRCFEIEPYDRTCYAGAAIAALDAGKNVGGACYTRPTA